jgi:hypothetical protein
MAIASDYAALIALAQADELDGIKRQILDRLEEIGMAPGRNLLIALAARRRELAADRRRAMEDPDFGSPDGEEAAYGG